MDTTTKESEMIWDGPGADELEDDFYCKQGIDLGATVEDEDAEGEQ